MVMSSPTSFTHRAWTHLVALLRGLAVLQRGGELLALEVEAPHGAALVLGHHLEEHLVRPQVNDARRRVRRQPAQRRAPARRWAPARKTRASPVLSLV
eukprot:9066172-Pyramimonas_sp.AAC.1